MNVNNSSNNTQIVMVETENQSTLMDLYLNQILCSQKFTSLILNGTARKKCMVKFLKQPDDGSNDCIMAVTGKHTTKIFYFSNFAHKPVASVERYAKRLPFIKIFFLIFYTLQQGLKSGDVVKCISKRNFGPFKLKK